MHKSNYKSQNESAILPVSKLSTYINHSISMDTKRVNPTFDRNIQNFRFVDYFSNYIVTVSAQKSYAHYSVNSLILH